MKNYQIVFFILIVMIISACSKEQVNDSVISIVVTPPDDYKVNETVHIVGDFNSWVLFGADAYPLKYENGKLVTKIPNNHENIFFGFVKNNDWQSIPSRKTGNSLCMFVHQASSTDSQLEIDIPAWKDDANSDVAHQTIVGDVQLLNDFDMPQLSRTGDISIYFPPSLAVENMSGNNVLFTALKNKKQLNNVKIYIDMGKMEYGNYEPVDQLYQLLLKSGASDENIKLIKDDLGRHCELDWSKRFPKAITWLLN